jgi:REP element-mobilizing transposase RayT
MARPPRIEYPGALYHIIVRGNRKQDIFHDEQDRLLYLDCLAHYKNERDFRLFAYVLMTNHVHLLIETGKTPISRIMQLLNFTYARHFNKKYGTVGHLFQGRYRGFICDKDEYLLALIRYLHLNPVRARIASSPDEYKWSSHNDYLSGKAKVVDTEQVLRMFSESKTSAKRLYREFILEAVGDGKKAEIYRGIEQQILGDDLFVEKIRGQIERDIIRPSKVTIDELMCVVSELTGIIPEALKSPSRHRDTVKARALGKANWDRYIYLVVP